MFFKKNSAIFHIFLGILKQNSTFQNRKRSSKAGEDGLKQDKDVLEQFLGQKTAFSGYVFCFKKFAKVRSHIARPKNSSKEN